MAALTCFSLRNREKRLAKGDANKCLDVIDAANEKVWATSSTRQGHNEPGPTRD